MCCICTIRQRRNAAQKLLEVVAKCIKTNLVFIATRQMLQFLFRIWGGILDREELMISFYWKCQNVEIIMQDISSLRDINTDKRQFHLRYFSVKINVNLYFNQLTEKWRQKIWFQLVDVKILKLIWREKYRWNWP